MPDPALQNDFSYMMQWSFLGVLIIPLGYTLGFIPMVLIHGAFGYNFGEWGTPLSNTLMHLASTLILGMAMGFYQIFMISKRFKVKLTWTYTLVGGIWLAEIITGLALIPVDLVRGQVRFIEGDPLRESAIFAFIGLMVGLLQWPLLKKKATRSWAWIPASTFGWGMMVFTVYLVSLLADQYMLIFFVGVLFYGLITGAALLWLMQPKENTTRAVADNE